MDQMIHMHWLSGVSLTGCMTKMRQCTTRYISSYFEFGYAVIFASIGLTNVWLLMGIYLNFWVFLAGFD